MNEIVAHGDYRQALAAVKQRIQAAQVRAVLAVNAELLALYWDIGRTLTNLQQERGWGAAVVEQMAKDLQSAYPGMAGFSRTSLFAMRQFHVFFGARHEFVPQPVGQIPWGHVRTLLAKIKDVDVALLYAGACVENGWSRVVLERQIEQQFHLRAGKAVGNFATTLPVPQSELVQQTLKAELLSVGRRRSAALGRRLADDRPDPVQDQGQTRCRVCTARYSEADGRQFLHYQGYSARRTGAATHHCGNRRRT